MCTIYLEPIRCATLGPRPPDLLYHSRYTRLMVDPMQVAIQTSAVRNLPRLLGHIELMMQVVFHTSAVLSHLSNSHAGVMADDMQIAILMISSAKSVQASLVTVG